MPEFKRVAVYARVSTKDQSVDPQLADLRDLCKRRGWEIKGEFVDEAISGTKRNRPKLDELMALAKRQRFDVVLVWRFDRFARSIVHLVMALDELRSYNVDFISHQESIDTTTPQGRMMFGVIASMAEFEREIIRARVISGMRYAQSRGVHIGRPKLPQYKIDQILSLRGQKSWREIAETVGVAKGTVQRTLSAPPLAADHKPLRNAEFIFDGAAA